MMISAYQINNVLRVYGDQLRQGRMSTRPNHNDTRVPDKISISTSARRKSIVDEIASTIVDRITRYGPSDNIEKEVFQKLENEYGRQLIVSEGTASDLIFKEIDDSGETVRSLSIEDSNFLSYKLKEITKETLDQNMV